MNWIQNTAARLRDRLSARGLILMYHRISEPDLDPWGLSVSPDHFAEQLEVIKKYFYPLSMKECVEHLQRGKVPNRSIVVTFDDGYVDNLYHAKPLLERSDVPATVFLVTEAILEEQNFWWDELEWALLQPGMLPDRLELKLNGNQYDWKLEAAQHYGLQERQTDRQRRPWDAAAGTRLAFFYLVWQRLRELSKSERLEALDRIRAWARVPSDPRRGDGALNKKEVNDLAAGGLIELGAHTKTHPSLNVLSVSQQMEEISGSKSQLEDMIGRRVISFSYPHGEYAPATLELVQRAGFQSASTTNFKCVFPGADRLQLPRFQVDDWNGAEFLRRLARWYALS